MSWLKETTGAIARGLRGLHDDEQGADALEKLLIIAAIVLPLLGVLYFLRGELSEWVQGIWDEMKGEGQEDLVN
jgi:Flp pilus assembly pilin Flp